MPVVWRAPLRIESGDRSRIVVQDVDHAADDAADRGTREPLVRGLLAGRRPRPRCRADPILGSVGVGRIRVASEAIQEPAAAIEA